MDNDIRPGNGPRSPHVPNALQPDPSVSNPIRPEPVDEQKIEAEFGPPPSDNMLNNSKKTSKLRKLLPAFTLTRRKLRRKDLLIGGIALAVLIIAGLSSYLVLQHYHPKVTPATTIPPKKKIVLVPKTVASTLTGLPVDPSVNDRTVTAVMIENSLDARPQSGLDQAGVVFEALAEGGVTRFMGLFQDSQPDYIGPVRSARPYYVQWALGFDAAYAHVGGSPDALNDINSWHVKDLNQFYNAGAYERISSRYAPHNVYTSIGQLGQVEINKKFGKSNYTGFLRKTESPSKTPNATSINVNFSGSYYDTHYDYDATTNSYKRSESGAPHMELHKDGTQAQITPKVVVAMIVPESNGALDSSGAYYANYASIGTGNVVVFQDGTVQTGTWSKTSNTAALTFADANGQPLKLNPGQTWIAAATAADKVSYH